MKRSTLTLVLLALQTGVMSAHADAPPQHYTLGADTVRDNDTKLTWQRGGDAMQYTWVAAAAYCAQLPVAGGGWRLPSLKELLTVVDPARTTAPAIDLNAFPDAKGDIYWSSNSYVVDTTYAWTIDFRNGNSAKDHSKTAAAYVRCVRR